MWYVRCLFINSDICWLKKSLWHLYDKFTIFRSASLEVTLSTVHLLRWRGSSLGISAQSSTLCSALHLFYLKQSLSSCCNHFFFLYQCLLSFYSIWSISANPVLLCPIYPCVFCFWRFLWQLLTVGSFGLGLSWAEFTKGICSISAL